MLLRRVVLIVSLGLLCGNLSLAQELTVDVDEVKNLVSKWNDAHTISTVDNFSHLYSGTVNFYGSSLQRDRCISIKRGLLQEQKDFKQGLKGDLFLSGYSSGVIRCDFVKSVTHDSTAVEYEAYLIIERISGKYLIVGESDLTTDQNITGAPDLGKKVTIRPRKAEPVRAADPAKEKSSTGSLSGLFQLGIALVVGIVGFIFVYRHFKKPASVKKSTHAETNPERITKPTHKDDHVEKGLAFEKFIIEQFAADKSYFTLLEWRSDKFHEGIFPASNRNPDFEYEYKAGTFVRKFSIECKYRSKVMNGYVHLMDDIKYRIYEAFHRTKMPVYVVLGLRGEPNEPEELFLIPFEFVKTEMPYDEIMKFKKAGKFFYDMHTDRLT
jgi:hypothetical protein